jgi:predicted ATP-grasp superfamily ATP-dependent carboligase
MKVFVYEHITSGALIDQPLPSSLAYEGNEMLTAIVHDMAQLIDIKLIILRDSRLKPLLDIIGNPHHQCSIIDNAPLFQLHYASAMNNADAVIIIAPETNGLLQTLQQSVLNHGKQLLGCQPLATQVCTDKALCYQQLTANNITSPYTILASEWLFNSFNSPSGFVVKPNDGAGCIDTLFFAERSALESWLTSPSQTNQQNVIQPYIEGNALSLTVLSDQHASCLLAINQQYIKLAKGQFSFHGCCVNGIVEAQFSLLKATDLIQKIDHAIAGLWGFIGIDLIVTNDETYVVDINPRVTTAYVGLNESLNLNPAKLLLTMKKHGLPTLPISTHRKAIEVLI